MKTTIPVTLLLCVLQSLSVSADECLCPAYPAFLLPTGDWYHYATVNEEAPGGCQYLYPTGYIGAQTYGRSCSTCSNCCTNCYPLPRRPESIETLSEMFVDVLPKYSDVNHEAGMRRFLKAAYSGEGDVDAYDEFSFTGPFGDSLSTGPTKPIVVVLQRKGVHFHAVVWKMQRAGIRGGIYVGVEIATPDSPLVTFNEQGFCNATVSTSDGNGIISHQMVPGLLEVQLVPDSRYRAFVLLNDSEANQTAGYPSCRE